MKPLSRRESAIQNDQAIETRRGAIPIGVSRSHANVPTEQRDYSRLEVLTVWMLIAVLVVLGCGGFYTLWSKVSGGW
jgi:hypothetical protein